MACSEDVQYFQFDKDGNMLVYEPGSGFSGECHLVRPGDELNLSWNRSKNLVSDASNSVSQSHVLPQPDSDSTVKAEDFQWTSR